MADLLRLQRWLAVVMMVVVVVTIASSLPLGVVCPAVPYRVSNPLLWSTRGD